MVNGVKESMYDVRRKAIDTPIHYLVRHYGLDGVPVRFPSLLPRAFANRQPLCFSRLLPRAGHRSADRRTASRLRNRPDVHDSVRHGSGMCWLSDLAYAGSEAIVGGPIRARMNRRKFHRSVILCLLGGTLLQAGSCIGVLVPSALAIIEQQVLSTLVVRLLPL